MATDIDGAAGQRRNGDRLAYWFSLGHLANDWAPSAIYLIAPAIALDFNLSPAQLGLLLTIHAVGASVAYVPAGILADRITHPGRPLLMTFWWVAAGYALASFATDFWSLALLLALAGMGDAAWHPIATGVLVQRAPRTRARMLGLHAVGGTLAEVLAPLTVGFLLAYMDWRTSLQISALPALILGLLFWPLVGRRLASIRPKKAKIHIRRLYDAWCRPQGLMLILTMVLYNMAFMAVLAMTPLFLQRDQGLTSIETGLAFATMLLLGAIGQPAIGHLSDGVGRKPVILAGTLLAALALVLVVTASTLWLLLLGLLAAAALATGIRSTVLASAVDLSPSGEATTLGLAFMLLDGVGALGAVLAGLLGDQDLRYAFAFAGALSLGAFIAALCLTFPSQRAQVETIEPN